MSICHIYALVNIIIVNININNHGLKYKTVILESFESLTQQSSIPSQVIGTYCEKGAIILFMLESVQIIISASITKSADTA